MAEGITIALKRSRGQTTEISDGIDTRSTKQKAYSPYQTSANHTNYLQKDMEMNTYTYPWYFQHEPTQSPKESRDNQVPPNVNLFSRDNYLTDSNNLDAEVSYYSSFSAPNQSNQMYDENRCSSTDTILSSSSASTVFSHGSVDAEISNEFEQGGQKRKRQTRQNKPSKKTKKKAKNIPYKRWPKPPYSYCGMIAVAIQMSPKHELTLQGIHAALMELFPFFRGSYTGWRDSVRHNLSHSSCFVKLPSEHPVMRAGIWTVDWSQVSPSIFNRQQSKVPGSETYKGTIHEHLGLKPYQSITSAKNDHHVDIDNKKTPSNLKSKNGKEKTPQMSDIQRFSVNLPEVEKCESNKDSPCHLRDQNNLLMQFNPTFTAHASNSETLNPLFGSFLDLIMESRRSSLDAAHHLQSLCAPVTQTTYAPFEDEKPSFYCDSDVYTPISPVNNAFESLSANKQNDLQNGIDASFEHGYTIMSSCDTTMTSYLDSDRRVTAREQTESPPYAVIEDATMVINEKTFTNI